MAYYPDIITDIPDMFICPYDKSHEIESERIQFHLVKCAKNFPNQEMVACHFNNLHRIPKPELPFHHLICGDKKKVDVFVHELGDAKCPVKNLISVGEGKVPKPGENWDAGPVRRSALETIQKEIEERPVLRALKVSSKAKKKSFHLQERQRLNDLIEATTKMNMGSAPQLKKKPSVPNMYTAPSGNGVGLVNQPGAGPSRTMPGVRTSIRDEFPSLPPPPNRSNGFLPPPPNRSNGFLPAPPNHSNGFCTLPIPGRGRGRPKNRD